MARILVYGGCHATVIHDMLQQLIPADMVSLSVLVNFELIRTAKPFPYEKLAEFDIVIYSPIENKESYNTSFLLDHCRRFGVRTISFPWLEWHGYSPGAAKGFFGGCAQWYYPELHRVASRFEVFESFLNFVISDFPTDWQKDWSDQTTTILRAMEVRNSTDVRVADFVQEKYRTSRLFLTPDHPSRVLYMHVVSQIIDLLGMDSWAMGLGQNRRPEPQAELRIPILPKIARCLDLDFADAVWVDTVRLPYTVASLTSYLRQYFNEPSVLLAPLDGATYEGELDEVPLDTRLLAQRLSDASADGFSDYVLLDTLSGREPASPHFRVNAQAWRTTWE